MNNWKNILKEIFDEEYRKKARKRFESEGKLRVKKFLEEVVQPAFEEIASEMSEYDRDVEVEIGRMSVSLRVYFEGNEEFYFAVKSRPYKEKEYSFPVLPLRDEKGDEFRAEVFLLEGPLQHDVTNYSQQEIIEEFLHQYKRHMQWNL